MHTTHMDDTCAHNTYVCTHMCINIQHKHTQCMHAIHSYTVTLFETVMKCSRILIIMYDFMCFHNKEVLSRTSYTDNNVTNKCNAFVDI